jgi:hypothetical protein
MNVMRDDEIESILRDEPALEPRAAFAGRVMRGVRAEHARAAAPIPFPWSRVIIGIALLVSVFAWTALIVTGHMAAPAAHPALAFACLVTVGTLLVLRLVLDSQET